MRWEKVVDSTGKELFDVDKWEYLNHTLYFPKIYDKYELNIKTILFASGETKLVFADIF